MINRQRRTEQLHSSDAIDTTELYEVLNSFRKGDFTVRLPAARTGIAGKIYDAVNEVIEYNEGLANELSRTSQIVGKEGNLIHRATLPGAASGSWTRCIESVNRLVTDLVQPTSDFARVIGGVARGDLSQRMHSEIDGRPLEGEFLRTVRTVNTMVDQLNSLASEVTRVSREVGTDGRMGGQAEVKGVGGTWKDLTDSVNFMAGNLTYQVRNIAEVTTAVARGNLSKKITVDARGEILELKNTINTMVDQLNSFASEVTRVAREVGTEGKLGGQALVQDVGGTWKDLTDNVNFMASNLTNQVRNIAAVTTAVAYGDLSRKITVDVQGEILELKNTINTMVDQLNSFASEVTRVAREVGTEGKLGGQAQVKGGAGTWKDLTESVNSMASNLTDQVRSISKVVNDVANGNLKRKLVLEAKGEIAELADTINGMIDTLSTFAEQVTTVAREVGVEGRLGGQANVPGAMGTWRDLTDNVNRLAANLTTQVRAIAEVATAVTKWDLSRSITVEAAGEVAELKDNINEMIRNLRETTEKSTAQDWLKTNIAKFTRLLQGQRDLLAVSSLILSELAPLVSVQHAVFYLNETTTEDEPELRLLASYAYQERKHTSDRFRLREGLVGQAAFEKKRILITETPRDYIQITSGLGESKPLSIVVLPAIFEGDVKAVIELASFQRFTDIHLTFLDQLSEIVGIMLNTITATMRTEELLKQSQNLAGELQSRQEELTESNMLLREQARTLSVSEERLREQQEELRRTNEELQEKAEQLAQQNTEVERKNVEIEQARKSLEEKAEQLVVSSKYKSEFLANMSHELRTPLNSMLILSRLFTENPESNLTPKQIEYAETIYGAGSDLLALINEILDLSKIEAGVMQIETGRVLVKDLRDFVEKSFRHVAEAKQLGFDVLVDNDVPAVIITDRQRLQQILKNLLSNAFKFTEEGEVRVHVQAARGGWSRSHETLNRASTNLAFVVKDTGIGIPAHKQRIVFEAFQQAETGLTRKYPGTGLGLSISRELARLLGGEIRLVSEPNKGSTFTLYLPQSDPFGSHNSRTILRSVGPVSVPEPVSKIRLDRELPTEAWAETEMADDHEDIQADDQVVLVIEDDMRFGRIMVDVARANGFKGIIATSGDEALKLARRFQPDSIVLDLELPGIHGWLVMDRLKHDPVTRHIPVYVVTAHDEREFSLNRGAIGFLKKPADWDQLSSVFQHLKRFIETRERYLLVVEGNESERQGIAELIGNGNVHTFGVGTGMEAIDVLCSNRIDCMVVNLGLPDMTGFELIKRIQANPGLEDLRIVIRTPRELSEEEDRELRQIAESTIVKQARSADRLLEEVSLFLHRPASVVRERKARIGYKDEADPILAGKRILIIDDDVRNLFALTSLFEGHKMDTLFAEGGEEGLEILDKNPNVHAILVDIMMPGLDGFEVIRKIRSRPEFTDLPVIALTAKAMQDDREACIAAGATDYVAKPADTEHLLSIVRTHLSRQLRSAG